MNPPEHRAEPRPSETRPSRRFRRFRDLPRHRKVLRISWIGLAIAAIACAIIFRQREPGDPVRPQTVEPFALADTNGHVHRLADWRDSRAIVLVLIGSTREASQKTASEVEKLARVYAPRGVGFYGICPDPSADARQLSASFPILLDPSQELTADLGVKSMDEAAVLDSEGHVLFHGAGDLEAAILAALRGQSALLPIEETTSASALPQPRPLGGDSVITYNKHVAPILNQHCVSCHRPGEVGPFSLLTYPNAAKRAASLRDVTASRRMPPWRTVHGYGDYYEDDRMSPRELATLARWAETGAPEGDPADRPEPPRFPPEGWRLGTPDVVVSMKETYTVPACNLDFYRTFVVPLPFDEDTAIAAVEFRPGNRKIVHHARFFVDESRELRLRDAADPEPGFSSIGGGDILKPGLGAWTPGVIPRWPEADVGKVVRKGSDLVILIHYHGTGKEETDRSSLGLYFCKTPPKRTITHVSLNSTKIDIPPGEKRHRITLTTTMAADSHAVSVLPHGHQLMREISLTATLPGGKIVPMMWVDDWDFNWQGQYHFARPVKLPKGTRLDVVAYYDNSAENPFNPNKPPRRVKFGLASVDEMLGCHVQVIADDDEAQKVFDRTLPFGL